MSEELERTVRDLDRGDFRGAQEHLRHELWRNPNAINIVNNIEMRPGHAHIQAQLRPDGDIRFTQIPVQGYGYNPGYQGYGERPIPVPVPVAPGFGLNIVIPLGHRHDR